MPISWKIESGIRLKDVEKLRNKILQMWLNKSIYKYMNIVFGIYIKTVRTFVPNQ